MPRVALVVDDDDAVRRCVAAMLTAAGFQVIEAADGIEALAALRAPGLPIRLVVSDVQMKGMDGISLFESVADEFADLPFIFMTGYAESERLVSAPADFPVITKPFLPEHLLSCIRRLLDGRPGDTDFETVTPMQPPTWIN